MSPNRLVVLITPLAAPLAGWIATQAATELPGLELPKSALEEIFIAGAVIALAPAAQWLHGWQKWEQQQAQTEQAVQVATVEAAAPPPTVQVDVQQEEAPVEDDGFDASFELEDEFDDFDDFEDDELFADEEPEPAGV
jgi:hypothetical protein